MKLIVKFSKWLILQFFCEYALTFFFLLEPKFLLKESTYLLSENI